MNSFLGCSRDVDLYSRKLGATPQKQNQVISDVMKQISTLDLVGQNTNDILGDAYEYLIGQFASDSGKNAGEVLYAAVGITAYYTNRDAQ